MPQSRPEPEAALTLESRLGGVLGDRTAGALNKAFGHETVGDLLAHYPRRYARRGELSALDTLPLDENVTIVADVLEVRKRSMRAKRGSIVEATISDGTGILTLTFFNQLWRADQLTPARCRRTRARVNSRTRRTNCSRRMTNCERRRTRTRGSRSPSRSIRRRRR
jgi:RecG-like helicase